MDEKQLEKMLTLAAAKLNMKPEELKASALSGDINSILSKMDEKSAEKVKSAIKDKNLTNDMLKKFKNGKF